MELDIEKLRAAMIEKQVNVTSLAKAAGLSKSCLNGYLRHGQRARTDSLGKLAAALGVPWETIAKA